MPRPCRIQLAALCLLLLIPSPSKPLQSEAQSRHVISLPNQETLQFSVEWRLIHAGDATLNWHPGDRPGGGGWQIDMKLQSVGMVSKLHPVNNLYTVLMNDRFCAERSRLDANEANKHRETTVTYDHAANRAAYVERDTETNKVVSEKTTEIPGCVQDVLGGMYKLRTLDLKVGQSVNIPVSDGKKSVSARVEAQKSEQVETPAGTYQATRYEIFLFRNVLYRRDASLYIWLSEDAKRLPVQLRVRMPFYIGTVTLQLVKEGRS